MAHFAKIGIDNIVTEVVFVQTIDCMTTGGIEKEEIGVEHLKTHHGHENWKKCSYNTFLGEHILGGTPYRANYPSVGWIYNSTHDIFHEPRPSDQDGDLCNSWTLNTTTGVYDPPIALPSLTDQMITDGKKWKWDESVYQADTSDPKTLGWISVQMPV